MMAMPLTMFPTTRPLTTAELRGDGVLPVRGCGGGRRRCPAPRRSAKVVRAIRPGGGRRNREKSLLAASSWMLAQELDVDPARVLDVDPARVPEATGRPSAVIAGATVTDSTVSVISRRQAAKCFAGSWSLSMPSGSMTLLSPPPPRIVPSLLCEQVRRVSSLSRQALRFRA
jgi:hypothetical protein